MRKPSKLLMQPVMRHCCLLSNMKHDLTHVLQLEFTDSPMWKPRKVVDQEAFLNWQLKLTHVGQKDLPMVQHVWSQERDKKGETVHQKWQNQLPKADNAIDRLFPSCVALLFQSEIKTKLIPASCMQHLTTVANSSSWTLFWITQNHCVFALSGIQQRWSLCSCWLGSCPLWKSHGRSFVFWMFFAPWQFHVHHGHDICGEVVLPLGWHNSSVRVRVMHHGALSGFPALVWFHHQNDWVPLLKSLQMSEQKITIEKFSRFPKHKIAIQWADKIAPEWAPIKAFKDKSDTRINKKNACQRKMQEKKTLSMENEGDSFLKWCIKVVTWTLNKDFDHDFVIFHHVTWTQLWRSAQAS